MATAGEQEQFRLANGFYEEANGVRGERTRAQSREDERTRRIPLQLAQHAQFVTADLRPTDVQRRIAPPYAHPSSAKRACFNIWSLALFIIWSLALFIRVFSPI